jgi:hypothetical protein
MQRNVAPTNNLRTVPESSLACGRLRRNAQAKHLQIAPPPSPATTGADFSARSHAITSNIRLVLTLCCNQTVCIGLTRLQLFHGRQGWFACNGEPNAGVPHPPIEELDTVLAFCTEIRLRWRVRAVEVLAEVCPSPCLGARLLVTRRRRFGGRFPLLPVPLGSPRRMTLIYVFQLADGFVLGARVTGRRWLLAGASTPP